MAQTLEKFADEILEIFPVIIREFLRQPNLKLSKLSLTVPQLFILEYLYRHGRSKMKELACFMSVKMATMTGIVDRLVRDGYLKRSLGTNDRRVVNVALSAKGAILAKKIHQARRQGVMHIFHHISAKDRASYLRILSQIRNVFQKDAHAS